ncbi:MAG: galactokinase [Sphingobacteriales bacterium 17-39-43]|uniref:galactokinase n=1 Tax=Daejeonella sp. TaxID=2805397 RepID=UPI000BD659F9|nr:galactokinase [Daejeonella sp.]OYX95139.1 MAG: galactokinase [Sphingobacteriia bacterium 35-40-5]OYZ32392.1 MAG: galactokinase [Sphingobacteriales bacterium 16-39-50]OZA25756.1 MAG: galactokinase [Sphingobacteriales bacterium 17-39-43]HQT22055.1 galactokinase [Daejeonella sp.]HQT57362.1 galactokinase [Daejeonella sp.]
MNDPITDYPKSIRNKFKELFGQEALIIRSPGRINLIGEHLDYNMGFVLPAAINKAIWLGVQKREDDGIRLHSLDYDDDYLSNIYDINPSGKLWPDYILGVVEQIRKNHSLKHGFNLVFGGDIPPGAGLSSSAALECATAFALNELFGLGYEKMDLVRIGQAAENEFVGVKCGIMDQFASVFGKKEHLIRLDCRSLESIYVPFHTNDIKILLFDTRVKHSLADSAYNQRREQCEKGVKLIQKFHPEVRSLRDASQEMLDTYVKAVDETVYRRCTYIVSEIKRLLNGCKDLEKDDLISFGKRMFETHAGLKDLYEVSCNELDLLVDLVKDNPNVIGARMMGGGFGGCTINLIKAEAANDLIKKVTDAYLSKTGTEMLVYEVEIEEGTGFN